MEKQDRLKLRVHRETLVEDIADPIPVLHGLIGRGVLGTQSDDYQTILAGKHPRDQTRLLLDILPTLGEDAFLAFVESVGSYREHLGKLLRSELSAKTTTRFVQESHCEPRTSIDASEDSDSDINLGPFPPTSPKDELVCYLQKELRTSYIDLGERKAAAVDFGERNEGEGPGLEDVCVTVSSLNFDDAQADMNKRVERLRGGDGRPDETGWIPRRELASKTFASRCRDEVELVNVGQLFRGTGGKRVDSILLVGPAGAGKSLLLERIMECWAGGKVEVLSDFDFVVYVSGRDASALQSSTAVGMLVSALERQVELSQEEKQALEKYLKMNSRRVLVLIDSADEAGDAWDASQALDRLFERRGLSRCTFLVTSRPCAAAYDLVLPCKRRYYLIGLNDRRLDELLVRRLGEKEGARVAKELKEVDRQHIRELMKSTPLVANMVAKLVKHGAKSLPSSTTQIYTAMALDTIHHQRLKCDKKLAKSQVMSLESLPDESRQMVEQLGKLALDCLQRRRFVVELQLAEGMCGAEAIGLGFLDKCIVKATGSSAGISHQVEFRHLTWLEYFAALYLCTKLESPCSAIRSCAELVGVEEETEPFWKFVCGLVSPMHLAEVLTDLHSVFFQRHRSELEKRQWEWLAVRCIAETAQQPVSSLLSRERRLSMERASAAVLPDTIDVNNSRLSVADAQVLSISLRYSPHVKTVCMKTCGLSPAHCAALRSGLEHTKELRLYGNADLHGGGLQELANSLSKCNEVQLEKLDIQECALTEGDCGAISEVLRQAPSLRFLWLGFNFLGSLGLLKLQRSLIESKLRVLILTNNDFDSRAGGVLAEVIGSNPHLERVGVAHNDLGNDGVRQVLQKGANCSRNLQMLDLCRTGVDDSVLDVLTECLLHRCAARQEGRVQPAVIHFNGNNISRAGLKEVAIRTGDGCQDCVKCDAVTVTRGTDVELDYEQFFEEHARQGGEGDLDISEQGIGDNGGKQIARLLRSDRNARALEMTFNSVRDAGAAALGTALEVNTTLRGLSLTRNRVGPVGFVAMATSLSTSNPTLSLLDLSDNPIFSGVQDVARRKTAREAIRRLVGGSSSLRFLGLGRTGLRDTECEAIGEALFSGECRLVFLRLSWNEISDVGVDSLCAGLEQNSTVLYIDVNRNSIGDRGVERIGRCAESRAQRCCPLRRVWLGRNPVDAELLTGCMVDGSFAYPPRTDRTTSLIKMYCT